MFCNKCGLNLPENSKFCPKCGEKNDKQGVEHKKTDEPKSLSVSNKNRRNGVLWLVIPAASLILILIIWSISTFVIQSIGGDSNIVVARIINVILGFLGVISVTLILIGIPMGIICLSKKTLDKGMIFDERSGNGSSSDFPEELKHWNWGAAFFSWIWGITNGVWISFLVFIPVVNWFWWIVLGVKGNHWAWENRKWESVAEFKRIQKKWNIWAIVIIVSFLGIGLLSTLSIVALGSARLQARDARRVADIKEIQIALEMYYNDAGSYPVTLNFGDSISYNGQTYISNIPTNPKPSDGNCPSDFEYKYASSDQKSYELTYCLGGGVGTYKSGISIATPNGTQNSTDDVSSSKAQLIQQIVEEAKKSIILPKQVDENTILDDITAESTAISYHYTISAIDSSQFLNESLKKYLVTSTCEDKDTMALLNEDINMEYSYNDKETQKNYSVLVTKNDCVY